MLPRAHSFWITDHQRNSCRERTNGVGHEAVLRPVAAADHVSSTARANGYGVICLKETATVGTDDEFGTALAVAVWIVAAEMIALAISPGPTDVLVAFVAGDDEHGLYVGRAAHGFQQMDRAHHVCCIRLNRFGIRQADQRLRGHVDHDFRIRIAQRLRQRCRIANVAHHVVYILVHSGRTKDTVFGLWWKREA